jgi:hypothetical protein
MNFGGIFQVKEIVRTLPENIQVTALFKSKDGKEVEELRTRCFWIGKVNEIFFQDNQEYVLNTFIAPVELSEGQFFYSGEASNFIGFEVSYNSKQKEIKK